MKKYATVPFRCKIKRFVRNVSSAGIRIKRTSEISFSRNKDITPDKTYTVGGEHFISIRSLLIAAAALLGAALTALIAARVAFCLAVGKASRKRK